MTVKTPWARYGNCFLVLNKYVADGSIAVNVWNEDDGPITNLTVCLDDKELGEGEAYLDTNNFPEAVQFVHEYGLGELTGYAGRSGYCVYPIVKFDMDALKKYEGRN